MKWISVEDRLPTETGRYLVYCAGEGALKGHEIGIYIKECGIFHIKYVTHWMPLPEPPKGETK